MSTMPFGQYQGQPLNEIRSSYLLWLWGEVELREPLKSVVQRELEARLSNYLNEIPDDERHSLVHEATIALQMEIATDPSPARSPGTCGVRVGRNDIARFCGTYPKIAATRQ
jgi:hypothetical protein